MFAETTGTLTMPLDINPILCRSGFALAGSSLAILGYEYLYSKFYKQSELPLYIGFLLILCRIVFSVSAIWLGGTMVLYFTGAANRVALGIGGLLCLWAASIAIQFGQNAVRRALGEPMVPVTWINRNAFDPRKKRK